MSDKRIQLSRRKLLAGLGSVGLASAGAGVGTTALFSDEESFENNAVMAGTLDLKVDWEEHYSFPQLYGFDDPTTTTDDDGNTVELDVTRSKPSSSSEYVGLPDPEDPLVWVHQDDLDTYMDNTAIEAFPDPDDDGSQEIDTGSFTYNPCEDGADLPADLGADLRTDSSTDDPLIKLEDVKPGDFGEFTFSFHLCDNPGYIWLQAADVTESGGDNPEPERAAGDTDNSANLAEHIQTIWWYDALGDNVPPQTDCKEGLYLTNTVDDPNQNPGDDPFGSPSDDTTKLYRAEIKNNGNAELTELFDFNNDITSGPNGGSDFDGDGVGDYNHVVSISASPDGKQIYAIDKFTNRLGAYDVPGDSFTDLGVINGAPNGSLQSAISPDGKLYFTVYGKSKLYVINDPDNSPTVDTEIELTDQSGDPIEVGGSDLAFLSDGTLYLFDGKVTDGTIDLYRLPDPSTGVGERIEQLPSDVGLPGLTVRKAGSGNLIGNDSENDQLYEIDPSDGSEVATYPMKLNGKGFNQEFGDMTAGQLCGQVFHRGSLASDLKTLKQRVPLDGVRGSAFDEFGNATPGAGANDARECFSGDVTHYIGFGWWVPEDVGNEIQGDSLSFNLGFYTEQCRDNDGAEEGT